MDTWIFNSKINKEIFLIQKTCKSRYHMVNNTHFLPHEKIYTLLLQNGYNDSNIPEHLIPEPAIVWFKNKEDKDMCSCVCF
jgi:hypothetical protein